MSYLSPQAVIDEIEGQLARDFQQRGSRLMPLTQSDVDSAITNVMTKLLHVVHSERHRGKRLHHKAIKQAAYLDHVQVSKELLNAINARRST